MLQATCSDARRDGPSATNVLQAGDQSVHDWYRFVLSFPPHLVRHYLEAFGVRPGMCVLDPFCGTGTTLVECQKLNIQSVGIEANPLAAFASCVKVDWTPDPGGLAQHARSVAEKAVRQLQGEGIEDNPALFPGARSTGSLRRLPAELHGLLLTDSVSPLPLHKTLILMEVLEASADARYAGHERLALATALVHSISNLRFGPEVGLGTVKPDAPVVSAWLERVMRIVRDLREVRGPSDAPSRVHCGDARNLAWLEPQSIDFVITSPPYPNEKDYTRTTRLESVLLGFIKSREDLRKLKRGLVRSNTRGVYKGDDDDQWVEDHPEVREVAEAIERRRVELGKTSGFERLYPRVTRLYFGGMVKHLAYLRPALRPGALLAYVVGDQASYLRIMIRTGQLLADLAQRLGYELQTIDLFRTRLATATREQLREEVVILRWPGSGRPDGRTRRW